MEKRYKLFQFFEKNLDLIIFTQKKFFFNFFPFFIKSSKNKCNPIKMNQPIAKHKKSRANSRYFRCIFNFLVLFYLLFELQILCSYKWIFCMASMLQGFLSSEFNGIYENGCAVQTKLAHGSCFKIIWLGIWTEMLRFNWLLKYYLKLKLLPNVLKNYE